MIFDFTGVLLILTGGTLLLAGGVVTLLGFIACHASASRLQQWWNERIR